jgi:type III restriction enzyme
VKRLDYQEQTVERFAEFLEVLSSERIEAEKADAIVRRAGLTVPIPDWCSQTWNKLRSSGRLPKAKNSQGHDYVPSWLARHDGIGRPVPNVCLKLPTGAGKTYLATRCIEQLQRLYYHRSTGLVLWIVPSDAIYQQTWNRLANREHPYRMTLERASGGRVKLLRRGNNFTKTDIDSHLCVLVMMLQATWHENTDPLRMFQDTGAYSGFFPEEGDEDAHKSLLGLVPNLDALDLSHEVPWGSGFAVRGSLANVLRLARPAVIMDEGQKAYSPNARNALARLNPSFIVELTATPNKGHDHLSNVLHSVTGMALKKEQMVKLPLILHNAGQGAWKDTLAAAHGKLNELQAAADQERDETGRYARPIMLVRVERTGRDQTDSGFVHADDVRRFFHEKLGANESEVAEKSSARDEVTGHDLMSDTCAVRYIITKDALREGWDCSFAYVLAILDETTAGTALTQMIGRVLRQPDAENFAEKRAVLNQCHVFVRRQNVADAVKCVRDGLESEGMGDLGLLIQASGVSASASASVAVEVERRKPFRHKIFLPRVLAREGNRWRLFDYESDLCPHVPWDTLAWKGARDFSPDDESSVFHTRVSVDIDQLDTTTASPLIKTEAGIKPKLDFPALARLLTDVVPNPWQAARILRAALTILRARGLTDEQIIASRYRLLETMRADLMAAIYQHTDRIFVDLLSRGDISFRIQGRDLSWEVADKVAVEVKRPPDYPLDKANGKPLRKSLFESVWSCQVNSLEKPVALYLDDQEAVRWWHRIAVQSDWYIDGWKKKRVFPDFLVALEGAGPKKFRLLVLETKGLHLLNEDTEYKRKLFETLERHLAQGVPVGDLVLSGSRVPMQFRLILEGDWKSQLDRALPSHSTPRRSRESKTKAK